MNKKKVTEIFKRLQKNLPNPKIELDYASPFELLVAVVLSAQSTDKGVNKATAKLFPVANTPEGFLKLGIIELKKFIQTIGLYNTKAKNIMRTCEILVHDHDGKVPNTRKALEKLPGVGRKSANVLLNSLFGEDTIGVDTHIFRIANRIGLAHGKTPLEIETQLMKIIPKEFLHNAHHWLVLHGRYICIARKPKCYACEIVDLCEFKDKNIYPDKK